MIQSLFEGSLDIVGDVHGEIGGLLSLLEVLGYDRRGVARKREAYEPPWSRKDDRRLWVRHVAQDHGTGRGGQDQDLPRACSV